MVSNSPCPPGPFLVAYAPLGASDLEVRVAEGDLGGPVGPVAAAQGVLLFLALFSSP